MNLTIIEFADLVKDKNLFDNVYNLKLAGMLSGARHEFNALHAISKIRKPKAKLILAQDKYPIGWGLLSREKSTFVFNRQPKGFFPKEDGTLFECFVARSHRQQGIGKQIVELALDIKETKQICFCPWDTNSERFFRQFKTNEVKYL